MMRGSRIGNGHVVTLLFVALTAIIGLAIDQTQVRVEAPCSAIATTDTAQLRAITSPASEVAAKEVMVGRVLRETEDFVADWHRGIDRGWAGMDEDTKKKLPAGYLQAWHKAADAPEGRQLIESILREAYDKTFTSPQLAAILDDPDVEKRPWYQERRQVLSDTLKSLAWAKRETQFRLIRGFLGG